MSDREQFAADVKYAIGWLTFPQSSIISTMVNATVHEGYTVRTVDGVRVHDVVGRRHGLLVTATVGFDLRSSELNCVRAVLNVFHDNVVHVGERRPPGVMLFDDYELNRIVDELMNVVDAIDQRQYARFHTNFDRNVELIGRSGYSTVINEVKLFTDVFDKNDCTLTRSMMFSTFTRGPLDVLVAARAARELFYPELRDINTFADVIAFMHTDVVPYLDEDVLFVNASDYTEYAFIMHDERPLLMSTSSRGTVFCIDDVAHEDAVADYSERELKRFKRRADLADKLSN